MGSQVLELWQRGNCCPNRVRFKGDIKIDSSKIHAQMEKCINVLNLSEKEACLRDIIFPCLGTGRNSLASNYVLLHLCTAFQAEDEFERGDFSPGDEATVNATLVNLITVLSMLLKMRGCVHHDRTNYSILSGDRKMELYRAGVDGLILHAGKDRVNAFIKVKRDFRDRNQAVRRQIAAQMTAFIYH